MIKKPQEPQTPKKEPCEICKKPLIDGQKHLVIDGKGNQKVYCKEHEGVGKK